MNIEERKLFQKYNQSLLQRSRTVCKRVLEGLVNYGVEVKGIIDENAKQNMNYKSVAKSLLRSEKGLMEQTQKVIFENNTFPQLNIYQTPTENLLIPRHLQ